MIIREFLLLNGYDVVPTDDGNACLYSRITEANVEISVYQWDDDTFDVRTVVLVSGRDFLKLEFFGQTADEIVNRLWWFEQRLVGIVNGLKGMDDVEKRAVSVTTGVHVSGFSVYEDDVCAVS